MRDIPFSYCYHEEPKWPTLTEIPVVGSTFDCGLYPTNYWRIWVEHKLFDAMSLPASASIINAIEKKLLVTIKCLPVYRLVFLPNFKTYQKRGVVQIVGMEEEIGRAKTEILNLLMNNYISLVETT